MGSSGAAGSLVLSGSMRGTHAAVADRAMEGGSEWGMCRVDRAGWDPRVAAGKADSAHGRPLAAPVGENRVWSKWV